ncbi:MAG: metallophosphoesterase [Desulfohalobiaceae bacterium]
MIEQTFLDKSDLSLGKRIIHFSDFHFKGDLEHGRKVVGLINSKKPDWVFFTGDLLEFGSRRYLEQALGLLKELRSPCYSVLGNHDPSDSKALDLYDQALVATGGKLLRNERLDMGSFVLHGVSSPNPLPEKEAKKKILLCHYPVVANIEVEQKYDLILCGHSHGGQVRLPFFGALIVPRGVGELIQGYYRAAAGDLYVNRGVGEFLIPIRLFCRPELTEIAV